MANWFPVGKEGANKVYVSQEDCEAAEGQACYEITGKDLRYHEVVDGEVVENADLKATVEAADAADDALAAQLEIKYRNMDFGKYILALVSIRNEAKELSPADVLNLTSSYAAIQGLLLNGSIATAKAQIEAIIPDGTLITQADLDAILAAINSYLGV